MFSLNKKVLLTTKAVFFDRDGVINQVLRRGGETFSPASLAEFKFTEGVDLQTKKLKQAGYLIIIVTNQPDIARGKLELSELEKMHGLIRNKLRVDDIFVCPHEDKDNCSCRKPKPGMLLEAIKKYQIDPSRSYLIGDSPRDVEAAQNAGCIGILLSTDYNEHCNYSRRVPDLSSAVDIIINSGNK